MESTHFPSTRCSLFRPFSPCFMLSLSPMFIVIFPFPFTHDPLFLFVSFVYFPCFHFHVCLTCFCPSPVFSTSRSMLSPFTPFPSCFLRSFCFTHISGVLNLMLYQTLEFFKKKKEQRMKTVTTMQGSKTISLATRKNFASETKRTKHRNALREDKVSPLIHTKSITLVEQLKGSHREWSRRSQAPGHALTGTLEHGRAP